MGKGDIRTRRGKVWRGTYGVTRPRRWKVAPRAAAVSTRKVKNLKDLPKEMVVEQPIKKIAEEETEPVMKAASSAEVETPVVETSFADDVEAADKKESAAKKAPPVKKAPAAKKAPAKKKQINPES